MTSYRQLTIWDILDEISEAPTTSTLDAVWECLDTELTNLPVEAQLTTAATAFYQIADILKTRAQLLLEDIRADSDTDGPVISTNIFAGLVRTTMHLELDDLIEEPPAQTFRSHGRHQFSRPSASIDSVAAPVEKENVLAMLDIQTVEDVHRLAGDEDVDKWQSAIAQYLVNVKDEISLPQLQHGLKMPIVEVWLGLLLGGFALEQRGDFYNSQNVWVKPSRNEVAGRKSQVASDNR
jgi:RNAse (barnase) inhibitor barstar